VGGQNNRPEIAEKNDKERESVSTNQDTHIVRQQIGNPFRGKKHPGGGEKQSSRKKKRGGEVRHKGLDHEEEQVHENVKSTRRVIYDERSTKWGISRIDNQVSGYFWKS